MRTFRCRYFWSRTIWPEFEVFWFNVILNKSSDYGVSAWHWYGPPGEGGQCCFPSFFLPPLRLLFACPPPLLRACVRVPSSREGRIRSRFMLVWWFRYLSSALPRMLLGTAVFLAAALMLPLSFWRKLGGALPAGRSNDHAENPATKDLSWELVLPMAAFVGMYSLLPHKELRFILYAVPALNAASAVAVSRAWTAAERRIASPGAFCRGFGVAVALVSCRTMLALGGWCR